jgi:hypothetical protein
MLISLFRSSYLPQYAFLVGITDLMWLPAFLVPPVIQHTQYSVQPVYNLLAGWLEGIPLTATIIGFAFLIIQALILNMILISQGLVAKNIMIPAIVYAVLMSSHYSNLTFTPVIFSVSFLLPLLSLVFRMYERTDNLTGLLSAGFLISFASMGYFPAIFFILFILYVLIIYRIVTWREWLVPFIGLVIPYLYLWVYYFWVDDLHGIYSGYGVFFTRIFNSSIPLNAGDIVIEVWMIVLLLLPALVRSMTSMSSYNILTRKKLSVSNWLLLITIVISFTTGSLLDNNIYTFGGAVVLAHYLDVMRRSAWNEIVFLLFTIAVMVNNFLHIYAQGFFG